MCCEAQWAKRSPSADLNLQPAKCHRKPHQLQLSFCLYVLLQTSGAVAADELWDEIGEEVPSEWEDSASQAPRKGAAVPAGDYFTVVKGTHIPL